MVKLAERADNLEKLLESVITMLGKVNERTVDLNIRVKKLEAHLEKTSHEEIKYCN